LLVLIVLFELQVLLSMLFIESIGSKLLRKALSKVLLHEPTSPITPINSPFLISILMFLRCTLTFFLILFSLISSLVRFVIFLSLSTSITVFLNVC